MSEWNKVKIGDIVVLVTKGATPTKLGGFVSNGINFIKSEAVDQYGRIDKSTFVFISSETHEKMKRSQLKKDDILFSMAGVYLGKTALVPEDALPANTNQALAIIRLDQEKALPRFIYYFFRQSAVIDLVNNISGQSAQPNINFEEIKSIDLNLPPLPEQKAIAEVLTSLDDKIDLLHKQNKTLEQLAETLFRYHFIDNAKDDWEEVKLGDLLEVLESGSRPKGGIDPDLKDGVPSIGAESINGIGNFKFGSTKFVTHEFFAKMNRGKIENRDVLIYKDGAYIGRKAMFGNDFPFKECAVNEHVFILRTNKRITQTFLYFFLEEEELRSLNTNSAQPGLNQTTLKSFDVTVPPQEKVYEFDKIVLPSMDKIFENSKQILILEKLRDQLLPKLMSGEITKENL